MSFLLIIAAWIFIMGYITITEQEDKTQKHEDVIKELNNEITELNKTVEELKAQEREIER